MTEKCLTRYLFYEVDRSDNTLMSIRLILAIKVAFGWIFALYTSYHVMTLVSKYKSNAKKPTDRLSLAIGICYMIWVTSNFLRDINAFSHLLDTEFSPLLHISQVMDRISRSAQLICFIILQSQW